MIDPVTALGVATTAFNAIKTGFQAGRDVEGMAGDLSRWMGAVSDICLLYTSPSPRDVEESRMPSSA